ncbi:hypothetical protein DL95DRAFT_385461 [Leptodontidium sp. 2 PMI_412]|nr:hypothetical protein DL95DRAFT_385461 [Leptodontidium sp. 2 PMI_412]
MQNTISPASPSRSASPQQAPPISAKRKRNRPISCNTCRSRRTRCGRQRPACSFCHSRGLDCQYEKEPEPQATGIERKLDEINQRLDCMNEILCQPSSQHYPQTNGFTRAKRQDINEEEKTPFKLLGTQRVMSILGLDAGFARELVRLERMALPRPGALTSRLYMVAHQQALSALASFSEHVHAWYPIFRPDFSDQYFRIISGPLSPSPETCVTLLVATIGLVAQYAPSMDGTQAEPTHIPYFEAALASLPIVLTDESLESVQSLILLSIYYCCLSRPCHAHDYCLIASFKIQNMLRHLDENDIEAHERLKRAYWAVLLLESELSVQFDVAQSGIWALDDEMALPDSRRTWHFDQEVWPSIDASTSPASVLSVTSLGSDKVQSYFLAEIAMRRMLHRCNTAIRKTEEGNLTYAPSIALELELQLNEWYEYLPEIIKFRMDDEIPQSSDVLSPSIFFPTPCPLSNFLCVQYYCCKISIYWPAVYQATEDAAVTNQLQDHCHRFFAAYIQLIPRILAAFNECIVNRWTLFASIFMTTMAAMKGASVPGLTRSVDNDRLRQCFALTSSVNRSMIGISPSLNLFANTLKQRVEEGSPMLSSGYNIAGHM